MGLPLLLLVRVVFQGCSVLHATWYELEARIFLTLLLLCSTQQVRHEAVNQNPDGCKGATCDVCSTLQHVPRAPELTGCVGGIALMT